MALERELLEADVIDLTEDGKGVADLGGQKVFIAGALPGERVRIAPRGRRRRYREAELVEILSPARGRISPRCEYFGRCGGCVLQHLAYADQVHAKETGVRETLARIGAVSPRRWLEPVTSPQWGYRRRARLGVKFVAGKNRVLVGFRERAAPFVTDMQHCAVLSPPADNLIGALADVIASTSIKTRIPQVEVAVGENRAAFVLRVLDPPSGEDERLLERFGERHGVDLYLQTGGPGTVSPLGGSGETLHYRLPRFGVTIQFGPTDFVQINAAVNEIMVEAAVDALEVQPTERVLDLFCGVGNFSLPLATRAGQVLGVEGEAGLVARAAANARLAGLGNVRFEVADLGETHSRFLREPCDLLLLDPPRTGAAAVVSQVPRMRPRRIAYVSCHPGTLARDSREIVKHGYTLDAVRVLDMFPHTHHVEVLAVFERA